MLTVKSFEFSPIRENTYLVYNEFNECAIIDPGCYYDQEKEAMAQFIEKMDLKPVMLLNTHCHLDHVFGNLYVANRYGLVPHIHRLEIPVLEYAPVAALMYNCPFDNYQGPLEYIDAGKQLKMGNDRLEVLFTPGHSPGSVSFYNPEGGFLVSGDVLFQRSIGRTDLPGGDLDTLLTSIREQLFVLPNETSVYSGHGPVTSIGDEKKFNPFLNQPPISS